MTDRYTLKDYERDELLEEGTDVLFGIIEEQRRQIARYRQKMGLSFETPNNRRARRRVKPDESIAHTIRHHIPFLKNRDDRTVCTDEDAVTHSLIKGDNFPALLALHAEYEGKVDVIYIDPPYNTGNRGFIYDDRYLDAEDTFRHSRWLGFMARRLLVAEELLSDGGVIFVSIDDHEQAHLKMLMDDIFGAGNFVGDLVRKTKSTTNDSADGFNMQHEYCLVYAKGKIRFSGKEKDFSRYKNPDDDPRGRWISDNPTARRGSPERNFFAVVNPYTGKEDYPPQGRYWRFSHEKLPSLIEQGTVVFKREHRDTHRGFIYKRHVSDVISRHEILNSLDLVDNQYTNQNATKETQRILGGGAFDYPKGSAFLRHLLTFCSSSATVLDFFAGSGTTGQAVAELNSEDGGSRTCILVTDAGKSDDGGADIAEDVTYERMRRVLTGQDWAAPDKAYATGGNLVMHEVDLLPLMDETGEALGGEALVAELVKRYVDRGVSELDAGVLAQRAYDRWFSYADAPLGDDLSRWD